MSRRQAFLRVILLCSLLISFICGTIIGESRGIPFVGTQTEFSIGIYVGESPFHFVPCSGTSNPVLTNKDVTDVNALFVADPFMAKEGSEWYMFFEVMNKTDHKGEIGLAISSDGIEWNYKQIVLSEPFHLSYPYVFKWEGNFII